MNRRKIYWVIRGVLHLTVTVLVWLAIAAVGYLAIAGALLLAPIIALQ